MGYDMPTSFGAVAATLGNVCGLGHVGRGSTITALVGSGETVACLLHAVGALELYTVLILFMPVYWPR